MAVLATAALALAALTAFTPRYQTNDDVVMNLIAAGLAGDASEAHRTEELIVKLGLEQIRAARAAGLRACATNLIEAAFGPSSAP